ncbi:MAG: hypothetical protein IJM59_03945 [Proteobacteria bacterium]|jgi:hypothetical protein|nr:hypothetical protein [Pseudomonadota bacterium]
MLHFKNCFTFTVVLLISLVSAAACAFADDDVLICTAEIVYDGNTYRVTEDARSIEDAKHEVIEEACDEVCDHLSGRAETACERSCEAKAEIRALDCREKVSKML